ncbi:SPASM domain-containing protein [Pseudoalteromonas sp. OOF1S-7]|uniref:radical SAM/SPASM domain-containing protein n=1 Tax=Pseudoalteromonas sp. OOF1S-7 TaxID=2917757 RepID=UPI001EF4134B|nr:SPASM domain-containing protein [Pseudoalteromonas sp. OOF1S-7]MCG7536146.1 SPASM domain-containing protein [Pseudoalteromonas sp. OOF1S-7]
MDNNIIQMFKAESGEVNRFDPQWSPSVDPFPSSFESSTPTLTKPRTSGYTIYVDLPDTEEEMLLVHGYLGHRVKVTRDVGLYLRSQEDKRPPRPLYGEWSDPDYRYADIPAPDSETLALLKSQGFLTRRTQAQELSFFRQFATQKAKRQVNTLPFYLIMPTYSCNLRCPYCFQDHMRTDPAYKHLLTTMSEETVDLIFEQLPVLEQRHQVDESQELTRTYKFFGGEPLLKETRPIVEYFMAKAKSHSKARFVAISNGTELHHYRDLLGEDGISEVQITLDGKPEEHDKRRIYPDGTGSFSLIAENITMALQAGVKIMARVNVDKSNLADLPALASVIKQYGWHRHKNFGSYLAVIVAHNDQTEDEECFGTRELNHAFNKLKQKYPDCDVFQADGDAMKKKARQAFDTGTGNNMVSQFCGAHSNMYVIDAFADIYACYEKTGDKKIRIGHFDKASGLNINQKNECNWRSRTVASNPICAQCRYALYCGGGCAINAEVRTGKLHANFCDSFGKRFRESIAEVYCERNAL